MKTKINVLKGFTFTYPNGEKENFAPGLREIDPEFVNHFFVKAHCGEAVTDENDLHAALDRAGLALLDMRNALDEQRTRANDLATQLASVGDELATERTRVNDLTQQLADATNAVNAAAAHATETEAAMAALATANADLTAQLAAKVKK